MVYTERVTKSASTAVGKRGAFSASSVKKVLNVPLGTPPLFFRLRP
jgi:hypothetical protein